MNTAGFVYCWTDRKTNKLYVGSRKGSPDDRYICSSKLMLEQYNLRPKDFSRQIIAEGAYSDMRQLESKLCEVVNAAKNPNFYNRNNQNGKFYCDEKAAKKISETRLKLFAEGRLTSPRYWAGKTQSEEANKKRSTKLKGTTPWNKNLTKETHPSLAIVGKKGSKTKQQQASLMSVDERKKRFGHMANRKRPDQASIMKEYWLDPIWKQKMLDKRSK